MVISQKQQQANRRNAEHSTGPKTPEGKEAVRFNALTWTLRARSLILPSDNPHDYQQLWNELEAEWQPQTQPERHYMEQMCVCHWLLTRTAQSESRVHESHLDFGEKLALLGRVDARRVNLERSYTAGLRELQRLQKERQARPQPQPEPAAKAAPAASPQPAEPAVPPPAYVMSQPEDAHPAFCSPETPDTR